MAAVKNQMEKEQAYLEAEAIEFAEYTYGEYEADEKMQMDEDRARDFGDKHDHYVFSNTDSLGPRW